MVPRGRHGLGTLRRLQSLATGHRFALAPGSASCSLSAGQLAHPVAACARGAIGGVGFFLHSRRLRTRDFPSPNSVSSCLAGRHQSFSVVVRIFTGRAAEWLFACRSHHELARARSSAAGGGAGTRYLCGGRRGDVFYYLLSGWYGGRRSSALCPRSAHALRSPCFWIIDVGTVDW